MFEFYGGWSVFIVDEVVDVVGYCLDLCFGY